MTSAPSEPPFPVPPSWPHCGRDATSADPVGCRGRCVEGATACLAHLDEADLDAYLMTLSSGTDIDHRGTAFTPELLHQLLAALRDPGDGLPHTGDAWFEGAAFHGDAGFDSVTFSGNAEFEGASFSGDARFGEVSFLGDAGFARTVFLGNADFEEAAFSRHAWFEEVSVSGNAEFGRAVFSHHVWFKDAVFSGPTRFRDTIIGRTAQFHGAAFADEARFERALFHDGATFDRATFSGAVGFSEATFTGSTHFREATFSGIADFVGATFSDDTRFEQAVFSDDVEFSGARFDHGAYFARTTFSQEVWFDGAAFFDDVRFDVARFETARHLGPLMCEKRVVLDHADFQQPVRVHIAARWVSCARTRWASTATLRLRYAQLDLTEAVFEYPVTVATHPKPFRTDTMDADSAPLRETGLSDREPAVRLMSVDGVDAAHLALKDIDLSQCRFAGAVHLDQLKVDGWCTFAASPRGWSPRFPWWWSRRNTLAEEHHWRARRTRRPSGVTPRAWTAAPQEAPELKAAAVAALYRQLRKSLEDGKNEPDAADFYYGECEMRRLDKTRPHWGERALLWLYWVLSGYGLRAWRALTWLAVAMTGTVTVMVLWGLPLDAPKPTTTGRQVGEGRNIVLTTETPDPVNPSGPVLERVSAERGEKALRVVINSVVFRSSGQDLTTTGTYTEMASQLAEPVLLGLAALAVRSRVKR
ncbi:pentapeptide repeat-containing protein [Streptomyces flavofungini]|uniref:pentapeptide repeat-containing protein n=1 Tax=Streptomyces flavofungini TaxID=68200 RepID=UPI0034DE2BA4